MREAPAAGEISTSISPSGSEDLLEEVKFDTVDTSPTLMLELDCGLKLFEYTPQGNADRFAGLTGTNVVVACASSSLQSRVSGASHPSPWLSGPYGMEPSQISCPEDARSASSEMLTERAGRESGVVREDASITSDKGISSTPW